MNAPRSAFVFAILLLAPRLALADDKVACVRAGETAQELRSSGKLVEAREQLLVCMRDSCPTLIRRDCTQWLGEVDASTPTIVVRARDGQGHDLRDVRVSMDGAVVAKALDGRPIAVDPGDHVIRYETAGAPPIEERLLFATGEKNRLLAVSFGSPRRADEPPPDPPRNDPPRVALPDAPVESASAPAMAWVFAGASVVAIGSFAIFGTIGRSDLDDLRATCAGHCADRDVDRAWSKLVIADVSLGVGVVAAGLATWLFLSPRARAVAAHTAIAPNAHGATLHFTAGF